VNAARSACKNPFKSLSLQQVQSSGRIETWKEFEGRTRSGVTSQKVKFRRKRCQVFGKKSLRSLNGRLKFSEGESPKFHGPLDLADQRKG
jgi:hypothetical protein